MSDRDMTGPEQMAARAMRETTDPTAGERVWFDGGDGHGYVYQYIGPIHYLCECGDYFLNRERWLAHKAESISTEPVAGDVEVVAVEVRNYLATHGGAVDESDPDGLRDFGRWLAARDAAVHRKAADDRAERIAQAIEADAVVPGVALECGQPEWTLVQVRLSDNMRAARIARETR